MQFFLGGGAMTLHKCFVDPKTSSDQIRIPLLALEMRKCVLNLTINNYNKK